MLNGLSEHMPSRLASHMHNTSISFSSRKCWRKSSFVARAPLIFKDATHSLSFTGFFFGCAGLIVLFDSIGGETVVGVDGLMSDDLVGGLIGLVENFGAGNFGAGGSGMVEETVDWLVVEVGIVDFVVVGPGGVDAEVAGAETVDWLVFGAEIVDTDVVGAGDFEAEVVVDEDVEAGLVGEMVEEVD